MDVPQCGFPKAEDGRLPEERHPSPATDVASPTAASNSVQMMDTAQAAAHAQGCHIMVAGISSANPAAVRVHTALGFQQTGHLRQVGRKNDQWLDLNLMQKTLSSP